MARTMKLTGQHRFRVSFHFWFIIFFVLLLAVFIWSGFLDRINQGQAASMVGGIIVTLMILTYGEVDYQMERRRRLRH